MKKSTLVTLFLLCGGSWSALAEVFIDPLPGSDPDTDCFQPAVAVGPDEFSMVAYTASGVVLMDFVVVQPIRTTLLPTSLPKELEPEAVTLGAGSSPAICWTREGYVCAFAGGGMILIFESDPDGNWDPENYTMIPAAGEVAGLDLWGVSSDAAGPHVFLTYQTWVNPPASDFRVYYAAGSALGWSAPELVAEETALMPHPDITWSLGPSGPWPTIFYLSQDLGETRLLYTTKDLAAGWSVPVAVPGDGVSAPTLLGGEFAVVTHADLTRHVLGLGAELDCACGSIHHQTTLPGGGWLPQEEMTVDHDAYDCPKSPLIAVDPSGKAYAFWTQLASNESMEPALRTLEFHVWSDGSWTDAGDFLVGQNDLGLGERVGLDVSPMGHPVLAWTRRDTIAGVPQPERVWIARDHSASAVESGDAPRLRATISVWPNPFNPRVKLAVDIPEAGPARLEIFDARGRQIQSLLRGPLSKGRHEVEWEGRDFSGRAMPSGVYFARLVAGQEITERKLLLAR